MKSLSSDAVFGEPTEVKGYTNAKLDEGVIFFQGGEWNFTTGDSVDGVFEVPVTLKNGLQEPRVDIVIQPPVFQPIDDNSIPVSGCDTLDPELRQTTVYYSINSGATQSFEASCK